MDVKMFVIGFAVLSMFSGCVGPQVFPGEDNGTNVSQAAELKRFGSLDEIKFFLSTRQMQQQRYYDTIAMPAVAMEASGAAKGAENDGGSQDYSQTNVQVEGVDEADFVKTDGKYVYALSGNQLVIIDAYPAEDAEILSETEITGSAIEFFVNGDDLVIFSRSWEDPWAYPASDTAESKIAPGHYGFDGTLITQYDISDRTEPEIERKISVQGEYFDSRMIGDYVYAIVNKYAYYYGEGDDGIRPPQIMVDGKELEDGFPDVYYFDVPAYSYRYSTVISLDLKNEDEPESKMYLMGDSTNMYVSEKNIYLTHQTIPEWDGPMPLNSIVGRMMPGFVPPPMPEYKDETAVHRIAIEGGKIEYKASGSVPGWVLNQFSMDEYDGYFRIATTTGHVARFAGQASSKNNVYVLDDELETVGKLEDLAPGEQIYSARFMGKKAYVVTFQKVDPLFVIDLSDPENPDVLGKLKIPGYSDYLHPYDENHVIGLGKEAIPSEEGDFSWYQGVKLSLFDVSDVEHPKEISKYEIGDRGTDSYALSDHKAFLFSKEKNLLVIPILLAELDEEQYPTGIADWQYGDYTFQGAYVFNLDLENGFKLKGRVSHVDESDDAYKKSGYYFYSPYDVKRSLYIDDVLYTVSESRVKMNDLDDLSEINEIDLPYENVDPWYGYYE